MSEKSNPQVKNRSFFRESASIALCKLFGIEIRLHISVVIIFLLIVFSLGAGVFPHWHPDWSVLLNWSTAMISGLLFFISLLAHELSHSVVSQHYGIPVPRITLFLFGGMAETSREADTPKEEFLIAIAGPLMSLVIAFLCSWLAGMLAGDIAVADAVENQQTDVFSNLGPAATIFFWLGSINLLLAIFNMIPGFPLDGGRVFRAAAWFLVKDKRKATRWASNGGKLFGWLLVAMGVVSLSGGNGLGGLWWILIGWFIANLAGMQYKLFNYEQSLRHFRVQDLMRTHFETVSAETTVQDFIDNYLLRSAQVLWPVEENGKTVGLLSLADVARVDSDGRHHKLIRDIAREPASVATLDPQTRGTDVLRQLAAGVDEPLPVIRDGKVVGLMHQSDVIKWANLHDTE